MTRIATRNGRPAYENAPRPLRQSDFPPRQIAETQPGLFKRIFGGR